MGEKNISFPKSKEIQSNKVVITFYSQIVEDLGFVGTKAKPPAKAPGYKLVVLTIFFLVIVRLPRSQSILQIYWIDIRDTNLLAIPRVVGQAQV